MKSRWLVLSVLFTTLALAGCLPEKRVLWSPDGKWALVRGDEGLYLCDEGGQLSPRMAERVDAVTWMPDSRQIILSRREPVHTWAEMAAVMSPERRAEVEARGPKFRSELLAHEGEWDTFKPRSLGGLSGGEALALLLYVRERRDAALVQRMGDKWADIEKVVGAVHLFQRGRIDDAGGLTLGDVLLRDVDNFQELRVSPQGRFVAYRRPMTDEDHTQCISVLPLKAGAAPRAVAEHAAQFYDWSPDGRAIVYAATKRAMTDESDELRLGTLLRQPVAGEDGAILEELPEPDELAGLVFQPEVRVRCLSDGRILFASFEMGLPCTAKDMPQRAALFAVHPERYPGVLRLVSRQVEPELPDAMALFEVSPDEQHVSIPGMDGRVVVLTLATGAICEVVAKDEVDRLRTEPAWRTDDELTVGVVPGAEGAKERAQVALARINWATCTAERRIISSAWPDEAVIGVLADKPKPEETQADSAPQ